MAIKRLFTTEGREFLARIPLSEPRKALLSEHTELLQVFEGFVKREDAWVRKLAKATPPAECCLNLPPKAGSWWYVELGSSLCTGSNFSKKRKVESS